MHIYLIVTKDCKQAYVYSNLSKAYNKEKELGESNINVYEWVQLWCDPIDYSTYNGDVCHVDHVSSLPWKMLKLAHEQDHWFTRAIYREELFDKTIERRKQ